MKPEWYPQCESAHEILEQAIDHFGPRAALSCSFGGPGGMVLVHMLSQMPVKVPVIFLDTQFLFPSTLHLRDEIVRRYDLEVLTFQPTLSPVQQEARYGKRLWERDPDRCCAMRKVEPMQRAIRELQLEAWISALRRDQSHTRQGIDTVEYQEMEPDRWIAKVYPLAGWTRKDVWAYIVRHNVPYNPLLDHGYTSLGCVQCTAIGSGQERSGRWPGHSKSECGLHTFTNR